MKRTVTNFKCFADEMKLRGNILHIVVFSFKNVRKFGKVAVFVLLKADKKVNLIITIV